MHCDKAIYAGHILSQFPEHLPDRQREPARKGMFFQAINSFA